MHWRAYQDNRAKRRRNSFGAMLTSMSILKGNLKAIFEETSPVIRGKESEKDLSEEVIDQLNDLGYYDLKKGFLVIVGSQRAEKLLDEISNNDLTEVIRSGIGFVYTGGSMFKIAWGKDGHMIYQF